MLKRMLAASLIVGLAAAVLTNCGGDGSSRKPIIGHGTVFAFVGDSPLCDVLAFHTAITGLTLTATSGGGTATVVNPNTQDIKVDFAALKDFSTVLNLASVPEGTYGQAKVTFAFAQMVVYDPTQPTLTRTIPVTFSTTNPTATIAPALTVTANQSIALQLDLNLRQSIQLDSNGQVTANVTPVLSATPVMASGTQGFGEMDDVVGFVTRVDTFSANPLFVGDLGIQLLGGTGGAPAITVNLPSAAPVCGPAAASDQPCSPLPLNQLLPGSFAEVDGFVDSNGNFEANSVEIEDQETVETNKIALLGYVTSVTKVAGALTQFNLYVRDEQPDDEAALATDSTVVVNVGPSTIYQFSSRSTNFTSLPFDSTSINVGQELVVHGVVTRPPAPPAGQTAGLSTVAPDRVYLKLQTDQGNFASLVQASSDDKTGAFKFTPCGSIFQGVPMMVFTNGPASPGKIQTAFVNVAGLNELRAQVPLLVKGLLFFEPQSITVNGVTVPAGTWVLLAKQVHQTI